MYLATVPTSHPFRDRRTGQHVPFRNFTVQPVPVEQAEAIAARLSGAKVRVLPKFRGACVFVPFHT